MPIKNYRARAAVLALALPGENARFWSSYGRWIVGVPVCFAFYFALELLGTWVLGLPFWQRLPSRTRVPLFVAVFALCMFGLLYFGNAHFSLVIR